MSGLLDWPILSSHILSVLIFLPLLGAFILLFMRNNCQVRWVTLAVSVVNFILSIALVQRFVPSMSGFQFIEHYTWIESLKIEYYLGVDGISVLFVFLSTLVGWISVLASWTSIKKSVKGFMMSLLVMQTTMIGVFCTLDLFFFYMLWEAMLIPMSLIIGIWGGPRRVYSAVKFFLFTFVGGKLLLVGLVALYLQAGTFSIPELMDYTFGFPLQVFVFILFFIGFAVKVPMFPFHTWLPDAHVEAPTAGSIILAGVLLKMGTYGFLRFSLPMLPDASMYFAFPIVVLSLIGIIYGAFLALAQTDMKKLIAYSSISHMGFITMGIFLFNKHGLEGSILQMFNHGITSGALFLCVGLVYERTHTRMLKDYGWAAKRMPFYALFLFIFALGSLGFPGTNGFIGELIILFGAYAVYKPYIFFMIIGVIVGVAYMLWMYQRVCFGAGHHGVLPDFHNDINLRTIKDINFREFLAILGFLIFVFWIGFQPMGYFNIMHESVANLITQVTGVSSIALGGF